MLRLGVFGRRRGEFRNAPPPWNATVPLVSVIVAAHNEESVIRAKIENVLASDYPREQLELLIGSDGSSDRTDQIVQQYAQEGVGLVSFPQQQGKSAIQNGLVALASGSTLVFTDADCAFEPAALRIIVETLSRPSVGLVSATPKYVNCADSAVTENEGVYLKYESWIRREESGRGLLAMASGSLFALRRESWQPLTRNLGDDFELPLRTALSGLKCIADPRLVATTRLSQSTPEAMFRLKARIVSKDLRALLAYRAILNPFRYGAMALSLWSHKLLRWLVPVFLLLMLAANLALLRSPVYQATLAGQAVFYALAAAGTVVIPSRRIPLISIPFSFCLVNLAALVGVVRCVRGKTSGQWTPVRGESVSA